METPSSQSDVRHAQLRRLGLAMAFFDLLVIALAVWTLAHNRHRYRERAEATTHNLALVLEQNLLANVRQIDLALQSVRDEVERRDVSTGPRGIEIHVQAQFARVPLIETLRVTDAAGRLEKLAGQGEEFHEDLSADPWFQHLRRTDDPGLFISPPAKDGADGAWVITLARRIEHPAGVFRGVVFAHVRLDRLTRELAQVDVGRHGSISLRGSDLELLARYPAYAGQDQGVGDTRISGDYLLAAQGGRDLHQFTTRSVLDGRTRTYTFRRLSQPTFYILVGLSQEDYLTPWWHEVWITGLAVAGLLTISLAMAWMARGAWHRQVAAQSERERLIQELTLALAEVKNLEGMLPICGHCKKIRDDRGYWNSVESYLSTHTDATLTHGICPDCAGRMREELQTRKQERSGNQAILPGPDNDGSASAG